MSSDLQTLMEMGFPENRANIISQCTSDRVVHREKALFKTQYKSVQIAMDWLFAHSEDADIDDPFEAPKGQTLGQATDTPPAGGDGSASAANGAEGATTNEEPQQAKSLKCDDCGKLLKSPDAAELHATRSGHTNFSESTEEIRPLTEEEKKEQLAKIQERIKQKRLEKAEQEKAEQVAKEKMRRVTGKEMSTTRQKLEEDEIKKMVEQRKREKEEEKKARQKVKDAIEKDKRDRAAKFAKASPSTPASPPTAVPSPAAQPAGGNQEKKEYTQARIQIRLTNGEALTHQFGAKESLSAVRLYTEMHRTDGDGPFTFMTTFPRKVYGGDDMDAPLESLGLVPSAVLIVTKPQ